MSWEEEEAEEEEEEEEKEREEEEECEDTEDREEWSPVGELVAFKGLQGATELNERVGRIKSYDNERKRHVGRAGGFMLQQVPFTADRGV